MAGGLRKYHTKSRNGCSQCKKRRKKVNVPGEAKSHLYLMHSVLAFSALHLAFVDIKNRNRHSYVASKQHEQALISFRSCVTEVNPYNSGAITVFSYLTAVYTLGLPIVFGFDSIESPLNNFIDMLAVLRQAWTAVGSAQSIVENGNLHELLRPNPIARTCTCAMHAKGSKVVRSLNYYFDTSPACEPENQHIYKEALAHWEHFFLAMPCRPPLWSHALVWVMTVPQAYFNLMLQKTPMSLVLLANWIIGLYRAPNMWFNQWAQQVMREIWKISNNETRKGLMWPAEVCNIIPKQFHPQGCLCWDCREGSPYTKVRDAASAVLVDRSKPGDSSSTSPPPSTQVVESFRKTPDWSRYSSSSPDL